MKKLVSVVGLMLLVALSVAKGFLNGMNFVDFHWESAALFLRGENPYQWFFDGRYFQGAYVDATQAPSTIAFILPYGLFSHHVGNLLWDISNLLFVAVFLFCVWRVWFKGEPRKVLLLAVLFLMGTPWRVCIGNGQHAMFSLMFFMLAYYAMERGKSKWLIGILMAASLFKYTVTVPMAFIFLFRREWKAMFTCGAIHIGLTVLLGWWTGCNPIGLVLQSMQIGTSLNSAGGDADLAGFMHTIGFGEVQLFALLGYVVWGVFLWVYAFTGKRDTLLKLATIAVISNVMFYHRVYDFVTLVFPLAYVMVHWQERGLGERAVRVLTLWNVVLVFFLSRVVGTCGAYVIVTFISQHALLAALLVRSYERGRVGEVIV